MEFLFDSSSETYWQSALDETLVTLQVELTAVTNLSKIFITFESVLPTFTTLEYMKNSMWTPLQYWADDCNERGLNERYVIHIIHTLTKYHYLTESVSNMIVIYSICHVDPVVQLISLKLYVLHIVAIKNPWSLW